MDNVNCNLQGVTMLPIKINWMGKIMIIHYQLLSYTLPTVTKQTSDKRLNELGFVLHRTTNNIYLLRNKIHKFEVYNCKKIIRSAI
jgi:hypothetical protein